MKNYFIVFLMLFLIIIGIPTYADVNISKPCQAQGYDEYLIDTQEYTLEPSWSSRYLNFTQPNSTLILENNSNLELESVGLIGCDVWNPTGFIRASGDRFNITVLGQSSFSSGNSSVKNMDGQFVYSENPIRVIVNGVSNNPKISKLSIFSTKSPTVDLELYSVNMPLENFIIDSPDPIGSKLNSLTVGDGVDFAFFWNGTYLPTGYLLDLDVNKITIAQKGFVAVAPSSVLPVDATVNGVLILTTDQDTNPHWNNYDNIKIEGRGIVVSQERLPNIQMPSTHQEFELDNGLNEDFFKTALKEFFNNQDRFSSNHDNPIKTLLDFNLNSKHYMYAPSDIYTYQPPETYEVTYKKADNTLIYKEIVDENTNITVGIKTQTAEGIDVPLGSNEEFEYWVDELGIKAEGSYTVNSSKTFTAQIRTKPADNPIPPVPVPPTTDVDEPEDYFPDYFEDDSETTPKDIPTDDDLIIYLKNGAIIYTKMRYKPLIEDDVYTLKGPAKVVYPNGNYIQSETLTIFDKDNDFTFLRKDDKLVTKTKSYPLENGMCLYLDGTVFYKDVPKASWEFEYVSEGALRNLERAHLDFDNSLYYPKRKVTDPEIQKVLDKAFMNTPLKVNYKEDFLKFTADWNILNKEFVERQHFGMIVENYFNSIQPYNLIREYPVYDDEKDIDTRALETVIRQNKGFIFIGRGMNKMKPKEHLLRNEFITVIVRYLRNTSR